MSSIIFPPDVTAETPLNTYYHPNNVARLGHGYDSVCSKCFLGISHNHAQHFQSLLWVALVKEFGGHWNWSSINTNVLYRFETAWWAANVPFPYVETRDRQSPRY